MVRTFPFLIFFSCTLTLWFLPILLYPTDSKGMKFSEVMLKRVNYHHLTRRSAFEDGGFKQKLSLFLYTRDHIYRTTITVQTLLIRLSPAFRPVLGTKVWSMTTLSGILPRCGLPPVGYSLLPGGPGPWYFHIPGRHKPGQTALIPYGYVHTDNRFYWKGTNGQFSPEPFFSVLYCSMVVNIPHPLSDTDFPKCRDRLIADISRSSVPIMS